MFHQVFICNKPQEGNPSSDQLMNVDNVKPDPEHGIDRTKNIKMDTEQIELSEIANNVELKLGIKFEVPTEESQQQDMGSNVISTDDDDMKVLTEEDIMTVKKENGNCGTTYLEQDSFEPPRNIHKIYIKECQVSGSLGFVESTLLQTKENAAAIIEKHIEESSVTLLTNGVGEYIVPDPLSSNNNISASSDSESNTNSTPAMSENGEDSCSDWEQEFLLSSNQLKSESKQPNQDKYCDNLNRIDKSLKPAEVKSTTKRIISPIPDYINNEDRSIKTAEVKSTTKRIISPIPDYINSEDRSIKTAEVKSTMKRIISAIPDNNPRLILSRVQEIDTGLRNQTDSSSSPILQKCSTVTEDKDPNKINKIKDTKINSKKKTVPKCSQPKSENSEESFLCSVCDKWFKSNSLLANHTKYSLCGGYKRKRVHQCDICGKLFNGSEKLQNHKNSHVNARPHKCSDCDKYFNSKAARLMHYKNMHKNIKVHHLCCYCGITSKNMLDILAHEEIHRLPEGAKIPTPFKCLRCGKGFISLYKLQKHKKEHRLKKCPNCSEEFLRDTQLRIHLEEVHNVVKLYTCNICTKTFKSRHTRNGHRKLHFKVLSFFCDICDKGFKTKQHIEQHMISHSDERPIHCPECDETFKRKTHLKQHIASAHRGGNKRRKVAK